jgi:hypothetical protein
MTFLFGWVACDRSLIFFLMLGGGGPDGPDGPCGPGGWLDGVSEII